MAMPDNRILFAAGSISSASRLQLAGGTITPRAFPLRWQLSDRREQNNPPHTELFPEKSPIKGPPLSQEGLDAAERSLTKLTFVPGPLTKKWT